MWLWANLARLHGHKSIQSKIKLSVLDYSPHNMLILQDCLFLSVTARAL